MERHFTIQELADACGISKQYVRTRFAFKCGVLYLGRVWRIPESVAERVYKSL
jgi:hypothetical protein